ncbi:hypothetical protein [uncultured Intestinimonas sp.]|uniref:hypothetical protein n=1 Tax=uncultured Intestinimonas sp. TaxID=1689265 RepID=UPI0025DA015C|nr:hypothetical protein [uncultured Intestinimonas sp.]
MDKNIKRQFESVRREYDKLKQGAIDDLSAYRSGMERVRSEASKYKDEKAYIDEHSGDLKYSTRKKIEESEKEFCDYIHGTIIPALRTALVDHMTAAPDRAFMQTLTYYNEFGIKLDSAEVKALSYDASGNSLALRCLASVAEKSGVSVRFPTVKEYSGIIDRLEKMAQPPLLFAGSMDYINEAAQVMPDMPLRRADGSIYGTAGRPSSTYLITQIQSVESIMKAVDNAGEKWAAQVVPEISEYKPYKDEDTGEEVTAAEQRAQDKLTAAQMIDAEDTATAEDEARRMGAEMAEANRKANEGLQYYINGGRSV